MGSFVPNPSFKPHLQTALYRAMSDTLQQTASDAKKGLSPAAIIRKSPVVTEGPRKEANGDVSGVVKYGRGLGPIFEGGTKQRHTRKGANRGAITTENRAMERAKESAIRRGLDLRRYL